MATSQILLDAGVVGRSTFYREEARIRVSRYQELWNMYLGEHWIQDVNNEGDPLVTVNYCAAFVEKAASFLMAPQGNNHIGVRFFAPHTPDDDDNPETKKEKTFNEAEILPFVERVWEANNKQMTLIEMAQMGGICGDVFVKVGWLEAETKTPLEQVAGEKHIPEFFDEWGNKLEVAPRAGRGQIVISVLDSAIVFPIFDEHNRDQMVSCSVLYFVTNPSDPLGDPVIYRETYTKEKIEIQLGDNKPVEYDNAIGEIPIVHIKNLNIPGRKFGKSDIHDIIGLQLQLNEKVTDISDIISYHAAPITIITGGKAGNLERGAKKVWSGLPKDAKVENLEMVSDLKASGEHIGRIKQSMHELTGVPESSLGKDMPISNTSGVALSIMYQPLLDRRNLKIATYGQGLQKINRLIIKIAEVMKQIKIPANTVDKYKTVIDFGDPLPKDELIALQVAAQEVALGLKSRITIMQERGVKEPEAELAAWMAEEAKIMEMQTDMQMKADANKAAATAAYKPAPSSAKSPSTKGKSNNPKGKADTRSQAAAKKALKSNLSGIDTKDYRPGDSTK